MFTIAMRALWQRLGRLNASVALLVVALGLLATAANLSLPIVRNSLIYARISRHLLNHDLKLWEVCGDPDLVYNKACGFSALAAPLVWAEGANRGLKVASLLGTVLLLAVTFWFCWRFNRYVGLSRDRIWLELLLVFYNPLLVYQFWSAYPDALFAALFLLSLILLDIVVDADSRHELLWTFAYGLVVLLALLIKHQALLLLVLHPIFLYWRRDRLGDKFRSSKPRFFALVLSLALAAAFVGWGILGHNPLLNLHANSGQYERPILYLDNVKHFVLFLGLTFGVLLLAGLPAIQVTSRDVGLALLAILYAHVLMVYQGADHNMRWYIPILPLMALYLARALQRLPRWLLGGALAIFLVVNLLTIAGFNHQGSNDALRGWLRRLPIPFEHFDNLRLTTQRRVASDFALINSSVPPGGTLYWLSDYYGDSSYHLFDRGALLRGDISVRYASKLENVRAREAEFFIYHFNQYFHRARVSVAVLPHQFEGAHVTRLSNQLHRVRRASDRTQTKPVQGP